MIFSGLMLAMVCDFEYGMQINKKISRFHLQDQMALLYARSGVNLGVQLIKSNQGKVDSEAIKIGTGKIILSIIPEAETLDINTVSLDKLKETFVKAGFEDAALKSKKIIEYRIRVRNLKSLDELCRILNLEDLYGTHEKKGIYDLVNVRNKREKNTEIFIIKSVGVAGNVYRSAITMIEKTKGVLSIFYSRI